jgi:hypothetical protein
MRDQVTGWSKSQIWIAADGKGFKGFFTNNDLGIVTKKLK